MPRRLWEELITMLCLDVPAARPHVHRHTLPEERHARAILDTLGLLQLLAWLRDTCPLPREACLHIWCQAHQMSYLLGQQPGMPADRFPSTNVDWEEVQRRAWKAPHRH
jgi:hypothetical protein